MHFTVTFVSDEDRDYSYGLVFVPAPLWVQGSREVLNLNPANPRYTAGSARRLLAKEKLEIPDGRKQCVAIAKPGGHGTAEDFKEMIRDLEVEGFAVTGILLPDDTRR